MIFAQAFVRVFVGIMAKIESWIELLILFYPIEGMRRFLYHLDLRVYWESFRIHQISDGKRPREGARFAIFVFYSSSRIPSFVQTLIDAVHRRGLNLVISTNAKLSPELRNTLLDNCCLLVERADIGRDIGGYKDSINIVRERFGELERLILINDSMFYFDDGLDDFIARLDDDSAVVGMSENVHEYYHIQSFAMAFGKQVLQDSRFQAFWKKYRPISTRKWAINKGERGLTRCVLRAGHKPLILFTAAQLARHFKGQDLEELVANVRMLPAGVRPSLIDALRELRLAKTTDRMPMLNSLSFSALTLNRLQERGQRQASVEDILKITERTLLMHEDHERWTADEFGSRITGIIGDRNQIHFGGFLFAKYLKSPGIKRDLFYRELFSLEEIEEHLSHVPETMRQEVLGDLRRKGTARLLKGLTRRLSQRGFI